MTTQQRSNQRGPAFHHQVFSRGWRLPPRHAFRQKKNGKQKQLKTKEMTSVNREERQRSETNHQRGDLKFTSEQISTHQSDK